MERHLRKRERSIIKEHSPATSTGTSFEFLNVINRVSKMNYLQVCREVTRWQMQPALILAQACLSDKHGFWRAGCWEGDVMRRLLSGGWSGRQGRDVWDQDIVYMCVKVSSHKLKLNMDSVALLSTGYFKFNLRVTVRWKVKLRKGT